MTPVLPTLARERRLLRENALVIACDEVGRGALAGPVAVGAVVVDASIIRRRIPEGLRDSKLIAQSRRAEVALRADAWVRESAVGWADAAEVDERGILPALGAAAVRALESLADRGVAVGDAVVILDGNYDYISRQTSASLRVSPVVKGDRDCASAAAASVIAKVARDALMLGLHEGEPHYRWDRNKGYASAEHRAVIRERGLSVHHRASWAISAAGSASLF